MSRTVNRLNALQVKRLTTPGWHPDGNGLYLQVSPSGSKSWVYRYQDNRKERRHGLGAYPPITLEKARAAVLQCQELRVEGIDPIDQKRKAKYQRCLEKNTSVTFRQAGSEYIESHRHGWKNRKHEAQWRTTLEKFVYPRIGDLTVQDVDVGKVINVLEPIWYTIPETASRVRQRIEAVLDWAKVRRYRTGDNPAQWRGHLDKILPKHTKIRKVKHFEAMPYTDVPSFYQGIRQIDSIAAKALAFLILTACRSGEVLGATWEEIDFKSGIWTIPEERMKAGKPHRVPLSSEAKDILSEMKIIMINDYIFPGQKVDYPISNTAVRNILTEDHPGITIHGFRSSFRDWCAETTNFSREVAEAALAHTIKDKTEAAYRRSDLYQKRCMLFETWAKYCKLNKNNTEVISIRKKQIGLMM